MGRTASKRREEARRLFLTGETSANSEIATRLGVKAHTVGRWRRGEDWDGLRMKIDIRAAELFIEKIASERVTLNVRHYRMWELLIARLAEDLKGKQALDIRALERIAGIIDRAQKGQRLAKGLSVTGETEETIRAQAQAETRRIVDTFIDSVKENIPDEETRERIRRSILSVLPEETGAGAGESQDTLSH
jgi:transposase